MRRIALDYLQPGMRVSRSIYNSDGQVLLRAGVILTNKYIKSLSRYGIHSLYVDDGLLDDIYIDDVISEKTRLKAISQVKNLLINARELGSSIIKPKDTFKTVGQIIDELLGNKSFMLNLADLRSVDDYTFHHSVNVCVLAIMTGIRLGYDRGKLLQSGIGALLHDLGKARIPERILNKPGPLTEGEFAEIKKHPRYGYEILFKERRIDPFSLKVIYQHHERYNGQGYPEGLSKNAIHDFASIAGIADTYDAITANRVYRKAYPPHEAFEMCAGSGDFLFPYPIVNAFLYNIAAYPTGTIVALNTGETAIVIDTPRGYSVLPRVRILLDPEGYPLQSPYEVSLKEKQNVFVVKVLDETMIAKIKNPGTTLGKSFSNPFISRISR